MQHYEIRPNRFLLWWLVGSVLVYPLAVIVAAVTMFVIAAVVSGLGSILRAPFYYTAPIFSVVYVGVMAGALGAGTGFSVGHIQRHLLRRYLYWTADYWRVLSTAGGFIGGLLTAGIIFLSPYNSTGNGIWLMPVMPLFMALVSLFQWRSLRHATRHASVWVIANIIASMVWSGVLFMNQPDPYARSYGLSMLVLGALAVAAQGFITGFLILWLFEKYAYPAVDGDKDDTPETPGRKPSVWDNAI